MLYTRLYEDLILLNTPLCSPFPETFATFGSWPFSLGFLFSFSNSAADEENTETVLESVLGKLCASATDECESGETEVGTSTTENI